MSMPTYDELKIGNSEILTKEKWNGLVEKVEERDQEILSVLTVNDGRVGLGTDSPKEAFQIGDRWTFHSGGSKYIGYNSQWEGGANKRLVEGYASLLGFDAKGTVQVKVGGDSTGIAGSTINFIDALDIKKDGKIGIGTSTPAAKLQVIGGAIMPAVGNSENAGILFPKDAYGGGGDSAYMRYYSRGGEHTTLEIGNKNDGEDIIMLNAAYTRFSTSHGWVDIGPKNSTWSHFYTDRDKYYFDKEIRVDSGKIGSYNENLQLCVKGESKMFIYESGHVGVGGVNSGVAVLHVRGDKTNNNFRGYNYLSGVRGSAVGWFDKPNNHVGVSIWADDRMVSSEFMAKSDLRIKSVIGISDSQVDLALLNQIEVTDYTYTDSVQYGKRKIKKVIGQQIAKVYPEAVSSDNTAFIPDIMKIVQLKDGKFELDTSIELVANTKIRLLFEDSTEEVMVLNRTDELIVVDTSIEGKAILYGREIHDFHTVDYEALGMLNISATQELFKRVQKLEQQLHQHSKTSFITQ